MEDETKLGFRYARELLFPIPPYTNTYAQPLVVHCNYLGPFKRRVLEVKKNAFNKPNISFLLLLFLTFTQKLSGKRKSIRQNELAQLRHNSLLNSYAQRPGFRGMTLKSPFCWLVESRIILEFNVFDFQED